jgi:hypothetical protein
MEETMTNDHVNAFFLREPENQIIVREVDGVRFYDFPVDCDEEELEELLASLVD